MAKGLVDKSSIELSTPTVAIKVVKKTVKELLNEKESSILRTKVEVPELNATFNEQKVIVKVGFGFHFKMIKCKAKYCLSKRKVLVMPLLGWSRIGSNFIY